MCVVFSVLLPFFFLLFHLSSSPSLSLFLCTFWLFLGIPNTPNLLPFFPTRVAALHTTIPLSRHKPISLLFFFSTGKRTNKKEEKRSVEFVFHIPSSLSLKNKKEKLNLRLSFFFFFYCCLLLLLLVRLGRFSVRRVSFFFFFFCVRWHSSFFLSHHCQTTRKSRANVSFFFFVKRAKSDWFSLISCWEVKECLCWFLGVASLTLYKLHLYLFFFFCVAFVFVSLKQIRALLILSFGNILV